MTNGKAFSYPGYNEMTHRLSERCHRQQRVRAEPDARRVFEWLNKFDEFHGRVAIYGTWNVFDEHLQQGAAAA